MTTPTNNTSSFQKPIGLKIADGISTILLGIISGIIDIADRILGH